MSSGDILGLIIVYLYVSILVFISEKILSRRYPIMGRKFLHIMTGNIAFILPLFTTREIMVFLAAAPFIILTFLISPYSTLKKLQIRASKAGHGLGLVYYSITWTILAYIFFDQREVIAIGILAMSYGDGLASLIGERYGRQRYNVLGDVKSYVGSCIMVLSTLICMISALIFYHVSLLYNTIFYLILIALAAGLAEGVTPKGLDNITVPFLTVFLYYLFSFKGLI
ncbi:MAG: SEC59/DGK1/VTE5 family protein [Candidatus Thermoplasmatota archaeon]